MLKKIDFGFALLTFILGIYVVLEGFSYGFTAADGQPGSGLFPIIVGFALIFFSAINVVRSRIDYLSIKEEFSLIVTKRMLIILLGNGLIISLMSFLGIMLSACGSNNGDSDGSGDSTGSGGYLSCVLEYTQARDAGIISATNAEISAECASESLP